MEEPFGKLATVAIQIHELFKAFVDAGFAEQQALYLVGKLLEGIIPGKAGE